jgi:hypothetical protein
MLKHYLEVIETYKKIRIQIPNGVPFTIQDIQAQSHISESQNEIQMEKEGFDPEKDEYKIGTEFQIGIPTGYAFFESLDPDKYCDPDPKFLISCFK